MVRLSVASEWTVYVCLPGATCSTKYFPARNLPSSAVPSRTMKPTPPPTNFHGRKKTTVEAPASGGGMSADGFDAAAGPPAAGVPAAGAATAGVATRGASGFGGPDAHATSEPAMKERTKTRFITQTPCLEN